MAASGDTEFDQFVARRYRSLVASAFLLLGDGGRAEDLVQSALFETFRHRSKLRASSAAEAYTRTSMIRLAERWQKRRWNQEIPVADVVADDSSVADPTNASAGAVDLRRAMSTLSMQHRTILVLRFYDDLSEAQCASVLGCSIGTVKSRTSRALQALRASVTTGDDLRPTGGRDVRT